MLDGAARIKDVVAAAAQDGQPAIGITDHGNMYGVLDFYAAAKKEGLNPIVGSELYMAAESRHERPTRRGRVDDGGGEGDTGEKLYYHLTALAETTEGYKNLMKLSSEAYLEGYYYKPRADFELFERHHKGVIATSGCLGGIVLQALLRDDEKLATERASKLQDIFGRDNFFIELQDHGLAEQKKTNPQLIKLAQRINAPLLATNDSHYTRREDHLAHDALLCVQTGSNIDDPKRFKFDGEEHYLKSAAEMRALFKDYPEACDNTLWIAERANVEIEFGKPKLPQFPLPEGFTSDSEYLRHITLEGARQRYTPNGGELPGDVLQRIDYELGVIQNMGFDAYFLVVWDLIEFAREAGIRVGPGRGCLAGDSQVLTPDGYKAIRDIEIGDTVRTHMREWMPVTNRFRYEVDEPLLHIRTYGDASGIAMTQDHKVLVKKCERETSHQRTKGGAVYSQVSSDAPAWLPAKEVQAGDLLCVPRPKSPGIAPEILDLAEFLPDRLPHDVEVTGDLIIERIPTNRSFDHSVRDVARRTGLDRSNIRFALEGKRLHTQARLAGYLAEQGFDSIDEWKWYLDKNAIETHIIDRFVEVNDDFLRLLGLFISDGWIRRESLRAVGWADCRSKSTGDIPLLIKRVWQLEAVPAEHATKDLTQWIIRSYAVRALYKALVSDYRFTADTKHLPDWVSDLSMPQKHSLLDGLWDGDGSRGGHWRYTTTSRRLMTQVRDLLWAIGAQAGVAEDNRPPGTHNSRREAWIITTRPHFQHPVPQFGAVSEDYVFQRVFKITETPNANEVFDIEVARDHSFMTDSYVVHNSAAGCCVAYCLRIVDLDPIKYDLLFERFLNPGRKQMPDIDMDFDERRRGEMIKYAARRYGWDRVAQIVTFSTIKARAAVRDASRVLGFPYVVGDKIAKLMPPLVMGRDTPLYACMEPHPKYEDGYKVAGELRELYKADPEAKKVIDVALGLEGLRRQDGIHAAAVVITNDPLTEYLPIQRKPGANENPQDAPIVTQYEMHGVEDLGLLKMDFLGLRNLSVIERCLDLIEASQRDELGPDAAVERFDIDNVALDDDKTLAMLRRGESIGVFQLEGTQMRALMRALSPTSFDDVAALVALYRPGPMAANMHMDYADRKNGRKPIEYFHPDAEEVLGDTQGLCLSGDTIVTDVVSGQRMRLADVQVLDNIHVQGVDEELRPAAAPVTHWVCNGEKDVFELKIKNGLSLKATSDHRVLTYNGWKEVGDLTTDDFIAVPKKLYSPLIERSVSDAELRLLGYLLGDGSLSCGESINFSNADKDVIAAFKESARAMFPELSLRQDETDSRTRVHLSNGPGWSARRSRPLDWLRSLGLKSAPGPEANGPDSESKFVPEFVFELTDANISVFLAARWDCDGHVGSKLAVYTTVSKQLAFDVQQLLMRLGFEATSYRRSYLRPEDGRHMNAYNVTVLDGELFAKSIQPLMKSKPKREKSFVSKPWGASLDRREVADAGKDAWNGTTRSLSERYGLSRLHFQENMIARHSRVHERTVATLVRGLGLEQLSAKLKLTWVRVESVVPAGTELVYDITVDGTHNFVANGMIVHNCIYQEQMMRLAQKFAGYSLEEADNLRKAAGKKVREVMAKERVKFVDGADRIGYGRELGTQIFDIIEPFADYAFNRSHSYGYGFVSFQTAYLKAHYPAEYLASLLTSVKDDKDKTAIYLAECRAMGIDVLVPDVNTSESDFVARHPEGAKVGTIPFGLSGVRNVGEGLVSFIVSERNKNGPYTDFYDFCQRVDSSVLNKRSVESLVKAGAFDSLGHPRLGLINVFEQIVDSTLARRRERDAGVLSLFGSVGDDETTFDDTRVPIPDHEYEKHQRLVEEKEMLGLYVSDHPLMGAEAALRKHTDCSIADTKDLKAGDMRVVGGIVTGLNRRYTKRGDLMATFTLEDLQSNIEVWVFPRTMQEWGSMLANDAIVCIKGRIDDRDDQLKLVAMEVKRPQLELDGAALPLNLLIPLNRMTDSLIDELKKLLAEHPGDSPVYLSMGDKKVKLPPQFSVTTDNGLIAELRVLLGATAVIL